MRNSIIFSIFLFLVTTLGCSAESPEYSLINLTKRYYTAQHASKFRQSYLLLDSKYKSYVSGDMWVENQKKVFIVFLPRPEDIQFKSFSIQPDTAKVVIAFDGIDSQMARPKLTEIAMRYADKGEDYMMHYGEKYFSDNREEYTVPRELTLDFSVADCACAPWLDFAPNVGIDLKPFENVSTWLKRLKERPSWKT